MQDPFMTGNIMGGPAGGMLVKSLLDSGWTMQDIQAAAQDPDGFALAASQSNKQPVDPQMFNQMTEGVRHHMAQTAAQQEQRQRLQQPFGPPPAPPPQQGMATAPHRGESGVYENKMAQDPRRTGQPTPPQEEPPFPWAALGQALTPQQGQQPQLMQAPLPGGPGAGGLRGGPIPGSLVQQYIASILRR